MAIGGPRKRREPLNIWLMALALVAAAFTGAALGLVWQSSGLGGAAETPAKAPKS